MAQPLKHPQSESGPGSGLFKGQFTTAQVGEDEAPRSSAAGARIEAPRGWGVVRGLGRGCALCP